MSDLYTLIDIGDNEEAKTCNACGEFVVVQKGEDGTVKHHSTCGGAAEVKKWEDYYEEENIELEKLEATL